MLFEGGPGFFCIPPTNECDHLYLLPEPPQGGRCLFPTHSSSAASSRSLLWPEPPGQAKSGVRRPARLAPESLSGFLRPRARWPRQRIQMRLLLRVRRPASGRESENVAGEVTAAAAHLPRASTRLPRRRPGPALTGCLRVPPAPPHPLRSASPHRRLCPPAAGGPSPFPSAPPRPRWPRSRRRRRERDGDEGVNPGLFPARRDPEPS